MRSRQSEFTSQGAKTTRKVDPAPSTLCTSMNAPCALAMFSASGKPSPWPPPLRARSARSEALVYREWMSIQLHNAHGLTMRIGVTSAFTNSAAQRRAGPALFYSPGDIHELGGEGKGFVLRTGGGHSPLHGAFPHTPLRSGVPSRALGAGAARFGLPPRVHGTRAVE